MKLTKRQILKIIREEAEGFNVARAFGAVQDRRDEEEAISDPEVEADVVLDVWAGGENLVEPIDQAEASGSEPVTSEQEIEEIVERVSRKLRIKKIIQEVDWVDPMAYIEDAEATKRAFASGDRISLMIDQPGFVGEVEPAADSEEVVELEERIARAFRGILKEEEEEAPASPEVKTQAGKKAGKALDKSGVQPLLTAINDAGSEAAVEEILGQIINQLSDDGKKYLKKAMTDIIRAQG